MRTWSSWLKSFLLFKKAQGLAPRTLEDYDFHVTRFFDAHPEALKDISALEEEVLQYFADNSEVAPAYFNTMRKCLRAFFGFLVEKEAVPSNPIKQISRRKEDETPRSVSEETLLKLLELPNKKTFAGLRDYALILLTLDTGIRPSEATRLLRHNIHTDLLQVEIPAPVAKSRVARTLPILPQTAQAVEDLVAARHTEWRGAVPVFCTEEGRLLGRVQWARRLREYSEGLEEPVTPYALRHSFSIMYLRNGGNAFGLQRMLGHKTMEMTRRYVALVQQDIEETHAIASPVHRLAPSKKRVRGIKK